MYEDEKINLVDDLDSILSEAPSSKTAPDSQIGQSTGKIAGTGVADQPTRGINFQSANIGEYTKGMSQQDQANFWKWLWEYLKELKRKQDEQGNPDQPVDMPEPHINAGFIKDNLPKLLEDLGYDNPYAIHQGQQPQRPEEEETMVLWDAISGRVRKFAVDYGDMKPQGQTEPMKSSREQNRDMQIGYSLASQQQRTAQPSGGKDPRGFEIPYGARTPIGASKEELDFNLAYDELMKRSQEMQKDPTQEDGPWQGHPAVDAFLDQVERLEKIKQADKMNPEGGQPQATPGGQGGGNPMDMMKKMMGGAGGAPPAGGMPPVPAKGKEEEGGGDLVSMIQKMMGGAQGAPPSAPQPPKEDDNELETFAQAVDKAPVAEPPKELQQLLQKLMGGAEGGAPKAPTAGSPPVDPDMISKMMGNIGSQPKRPAKKKKGPSPRLLQALLSRLGG